jgi:hypothetical protein
VELKIKLRKGKTDIMSSVVVTAKTTNSNNDDDDNDIIEINAAGKVMTALRSTLCLAPDTMFSTMFSGRWEGSLVRDVNGRIYLDHDPELIEIIVDFLRMKKIEDPYDILEFPDVPVRKKKNILRLLRYLGLTDFFNPRVCDLAIFDMVQPNGNFVDISKTENKIQFSYDKLWMGG